MTKNTRKRNKPTVGGKSVSAKSVFNKSKNSDTLRVKNYDLSVIDGLSAIDSYGNISLLIAQAMVVIAMLCQMRALRPDGNSSALDQLPSWRYYKKTIILNNPGHALAISLASGQPEVIVLLPDDPQELELYLIAVLDSLQGNEKFLQNVNESNLADYICGHCSRILGILNSCPAANMGAFSFDASVAGLNVAGVLQRVPLDSVRELDPAIVIEEIRKACLRKDYDGNIVALEFAELPFVGSYTEGCCCKIEKEIFGKLSPVRTGGNKLGLGKSSNSSKVIDGAEDHLTPLELRKYQAAVLIQKRNLVSHYEALIAKRKTAAEAESTTPAVSDGLESAVNQEAGTGVDQGTVTPRSPKRPRKSSAEDAD